MLNNQRGSVVYIVFLVLIVISSVTSLFMSLTARDLKKRNTELNAKIVDLTSRVIAVKGKDGKKILVKPLSRDQYFQMVNILDLAGKCYNANDSNYGGHQVPEECLKGNFFRHD